MADVLQFPGPPPGGSSDLIRALEKLLADARDDKLRYFAFVAEREHHDYLVDMAGVTDQPIAIRRMLQLLDDRLAELTKGQ